MALTETNLRRIRLAVHNSKTPHKPIHMCGRFQSKTTREQRKLQSQISNYAQRHNEAVERERLRLSRLPLPAIEPMPVAVAALDCFVNRTLALVEDYFVGGALAAD